jgi:hypothetical protein
MTVAPDVSVDELRGRIADGLQLTVDKLGGGYTAPLRRQPRAGDEDYGAAVLCLGLGSIRGEEAKTLPCALTLGLLEEMGRVLLGLEDGSSIIGAWGMPRTLNAADGLYALGRQILLSHEALDAESRLEALAVYTAAARSLSEALHAWSPQGDGALHNAARSLYAAAAALAALCCGLEGDSRQRLAALSEDAAAESVEAALVKASALLLRKA